MLKIIEKPILWANEVIARSRLISDIASEIESSGEINRTRGNQTFEELYTVSFPSGSARFRTSTTELNQTDSFGSSLIPTGEGILELSGGKKLNLSTRETLILADASRVRSQMIENQTSTASYKS